MKYIKTNTFFTYKKLYSIKILNKEYIKIRNFILKNAKEDK